MANYNELFSFTVDVDNPAQVVETITNALEAHQDGTDLAAGAVTAEAIFGDEADWAGGLAVEVSGDDSIWIYDNGNDNVQAAVSLVEWIVRNVEGAPDEVFIEWANTCSRPLLGVHGGGAALVTPNGTIVKGTNQLDGILRAEQPIRSLLEEVQRWEDDRARIDHAAANGEPLLVNGDDEEAVVDAYPDSDDAAVRLLRALAGVLAESALS